MVFSFIFTFTLKKVYILMAWKKKQLKNKAKPCCSLVSSIGQYGFIFFFLLLFYWIFKGGNCSFIFCFAFKWLTSSTSVTSIICGRHLRRKTGSYTNRCKFVNYFSQIGTEKGLFFLEICIQWRRMWTHCGTRICPYVMELLYLCMSASNEKISHNNTFHT